MHLTTKALEVIEKNLPTLNARRTPGQSSIGRKQESYIGGRLTLPFNKGGKVKAKSKKAKKKK